MAAPLPIAQHRWAPGQSGNPLGRPKGFKAVAAAIMRETGDGEELVRFALETWRNVDPHGRAGQGNRSFDERWQAFCWLADRGIGKPVAMVELAAQLELGAPRSDDALEQRLDALTPELMQALAVMGLLPAGNGQLVMAAPPIDAEAVERVDSTGTEHDQEHEADAASSTETDG